MSFAIPKTPMGLILNICFTPYILLLMYSHRLIIPSKPISSNIIIWASFSLVLNTGHLSPGAYFFHFRFHLVFCFLLSRWQLAAPAHPLDSRFYFLFPMLFCHANDMQSGGEGGTRITCSTIILEETKAKTKTKTQTMINWKHEGKTGSVKPTIKYTFKCNWLKNFNFQRLLLNNMPIRCW